MEILLVLAACILASQGVFEPLGFLLLFSLARDIRNGHRLYHERRHTFSALTHRLIFKSTQWAFITPLAIAMVLFRWIEKQVWATTEFPIIGWYLVTVCYISGFHLLVAATQILKTGPVQFFYGSDFIGTTIRLRKPLHVRIFGGAYIVLGVLLHLMILGKIGHTSWT